MSRPCRRVLVVGWDGAPWSVLRPLLAAGDLPTLARLLEDGSSGGLRSTIPPLSPHAWASFMTGVNAGKHGIFGFAEPQPGSYGVRFLGGHSLRSEPVWCLLSRQGLDVGVMNVPVTYPPREVKGFLVSGMDTPGTEVAYTFPRELKEEIRREVGDYRIDLSFVGSLTPATRRRVVARLRDMEEVRARAAEHLMRRHPWDLMVVVFTACDRLFHFFWHCYDPEHPAYGRPENEEFRGVIPGMFRQLDRALGRLVEAAGPEAAVILMSDHGSGPYVDGIEELNIPEWLLREGYLCARESRDRGGMLSRARSLAFSGARLGRGLLRRTLPSEARLRLRRMFPGAFASTQSFLYFSGVDWEKTRAYASYDEVLPRGIRLNLKGREPMGTVEPGEPYEALRVELMEKLRRLVHPLTGEPLVAGVYRREELYGGPETGRASDIVVEWSERALFPVRAGEPPLPPRRRARVFPLSDHGRTGEHRPEGICVLRGPAIFHGKHDLAAKMVDLAPTILYLLGQPVPLEMDGRVLLEALDPEVVREHPVKVSSERVTAVSRGEAGYDAEEEEKVRERLRALGYIQ